MRNVFAALLLALPVAHSVAEPPQRSAGDAVIRAPAGASEIVISTTARLAGAIHSLTWNGREFIDSTDHGRQLQSATNFDFGSPITAETFNPTEAGSRSDGAGPTSSSRLLHLLARGNQLQTTSQMAFWLRPGERSGPHPAKNTTVLSDHLLTKQVTIGWRGKPHVVAYDTSFTLPPGEPHAHAVLEVLTGYMPAAFETFWKLNPQTGQLEPLSDGPGEQPWPVVLATANGSHAMGIFTPHTPRSGESGPGYGRWRFGPQRVVKWNCVFRLTDESRKVAPRLWSCRAFVVVGDLETVRTNLIDLRQQPVE